MSPRWAGWLMVVLVGAVIGGSARPKLVHTEFVPQASKAVAPGQLDQACAAMRVRLKGVRGAMVTTDGNRIGVGLPVGANAARWLNLATRKGELAFVLMPADLEGRTSANRTVEWVEKETGRTVPEPAALAAGQVVFDGTDLSPTPRVEREPAGTTWEVVYQFGPQNKTAFESLTAQNVGRYLAMTLDGKTLMAQAIRAAMPGVGVIAGSFSREEAEDLSCLVSGGPLPFPLRPAGPVPTAAARP